MGCSDGELAKRVGVALVGIPMAVAFAYMGGFWLAGLVAVMAWAAAWEFYTMYAAQGVMSGRVVGSFVALVYVFLAAMLTPKDFTVWAVAITMAMALVVVLRTSPNSRPGLATVVTVFGAGYAGGLLAFAVWLRAVDAAVGWRGAAILFLPISITWLGDTAAYSIGKAVGRHKLAPTISPGKTWEGAVAGFGATTGGAVLFVGLSHSLVGWAMSTVEVLGFGAAVALAGQAGDLVESRFKRDCDVKDSSRVLPGHGGVLDRLDSLLFVFPISYAYLLVVGV